MSATTGKILVPLEELGAQLGGGNAETAAARLAATGHGVPVEDWQGRLCVPAEIAAEAVNAYQLEIEEAEARQAAYRLYVNERDGRRRAAGEKAAEKARLAVRQADRAYQRETFAGLVGELGDSPHAYQAAREAFSAAVVEFDRKHPLKPFEKFKG